MASSRRLYIGHYGLPIKKNAVKTINVNALINAKLGSAALPCPTTHHREITSYAPAMPHGNQSDALEFIMGVNSGCPLSRTDFSCGRS